MVFRNILYINCFIFTVHWIEAEVFTAMSDLEPLIDTLGKVVINLEKYLLMEKYRLNELEKQLHVYKKLYFSSTKDPSKYLENPINSFTIIKRLTVDVNSTEQNIYLAKENIENIYRFSNDTLFPTSDDLVGSASALSRLQYTYELNVSDLAEGRLAGEKCSEPMTANDCFILGKTLFNTTNYVHALLWLEEALRKYESERNVCDITFVEILKYISYAYYNLDYIEEALKWNEKILKLNPNNMEALSDMVEFQKTLYEDNEILEWDNSTESMDDHSDNVKNILAEEEQVYTALCRGDIEIPESKRKRLTCKYLTENHPFLKLAPIKVEQLHAEPDVFLFHHVMSDDEIKHLKNKAKPKFKRATIINPAGVGQVITYNRISKSGWLWDNESAVVNRITQRVSDFTGLDMKTAEYLQVANYGMGGHYVPHFDFTMGHISADKVFGKGVGNRIATVLFYMSDVPLGGATAFTELGFRVLPVKNAALFWMNLHPSGEGNIATRHAACPVLQGSKWGNYGRYSPPTLGVHYSNVEDQPDKKKSCRNNGFTEQTYIPTITSVNVATSKPPAAASGIIPTRAPAAAVAKPHSTTISNKWIHQYGQELIRPCDLDYEEESGKNLPVSVKVNTKNRELRKIIHNWYRERGIRRMINNA